MFAALQELRTFFGIPFTHFVLEDLLLSTVYSGTGSWWLDGGSNGRSITFHVRTAVPTCKFTWIRIPGNLALVAAGACDDPSLGASRRRALLPNA